MSGVINYGEKNPEILLNMIDSILLNVGQNLRNPKPHKGYFYLYWMSETFSLFFMRT